MRNEQVYGHYDRTLVKGGGRAHNGKQSIQVPRAHVADYDSLTNPRQPPPMLETTGYGVSGPQWMVNGGPPPLIYHLSPYASVPLPTLSQSPANVNPLLTPHGDATITWNVCNKPITAGCSRNFTSRDTYHWQNLQATDAPWLSSLAIYVSPFPNPIVVFPTRGAITVADIISAVYEGLRRFAKSELQADRHGRRRRTKPKSSWGGIVIDEEAEDVKLFMGFRSYWDGLVPSANDPDAWVLLTKSTALR